MQTRIFGFMNWWLLAVGAILLAVAGLTAVLTLHLVKGPTPFGVSSSLHKIVFFFS